MDSLLVDLDKVLDDFEAEENLAPGSELHPSGFQEYLENDNEKTWSQIENVEASGPSNIVNHVDNTDKESANIRYDFPYEPETFDLSEADFAPSVNIGEPSGHEVPKAMNFDKTSLEKGSHVHTSQVNGNTPSHNYNDVNQSDLSKPVLNELKIVSNDLGCERSKFPVQADNSPSSELAQQAFHMNGHLAENEVLLPKKNNTDVNCKQNNEETASGPVLSNFDPNLNYDKYPVQCNTPQTPKDNPFVNPLDSQIKLQKTDTMSQNNTKTENGVGFGPDTMQDKSNLNNLKEELATQVNTNTGVQNVRKFCHSLPANIHEQMMQNQPPRPGTGSSLPLVLPEQNTNELIQKNPQHKLEGGQVQTAGKAPETGSVMAPEQLMKNQNKNVVGFGDIDVNLNEKELNDYLGYDSKSMAHITSQSSRAGQNTSVSAKSDSEFHINHTTNYEGEKMHLGEKAFVEGEPKVNNADIKVNNGEKAGQAVVVGQAAFAEPPAVNVQMSNNSVDSDLEVLKLLPTDTSCLVSAKSEPVISNADTNLSPCANISLDSGCASMEHANQTMDAGARPKDTQNKGNRPSSLTGIPTNNTNPETCFEGMSDISGLGYPGSKNNSGTQQDSIKVSEKVSEYYSDSNVVQDSRQLMDVGGGNTSVSDNIPTDLNMDVVQTNQDTGMQNVSGNTDMTDDAMESDVELRHPSGAHVDGNGRPHSWSPSDTGQGQPQKQKRPTSLNLPPPPAFSPNADRMEDDAELTPEESGATGGSEVAEASGTDNPENPQGATSGAEAPVVPQNQQAGYGPPPPYSAVGKVAPKWIPDAEAPACMNCDVKFTFTKRRHHCRACGKVFCSACCNMKNKLEHLNFQEARVCLQCHRELALANMNTGTMPHPNNPGDYTVMGPQAGGGQPPPPSVLVPVQGVLKRDGHAHSGMNTDGGNRRSEPKQVMFSDGIRPGGDLTELDGRSEMSRMPPRRSRVQKRVERVGHGGGQHSPRSRRLRTVTDRTVKCLIPEEGLPPLSVPVEGGTGHTLQLNPDPESFMPKIKDEQSPPVIFAVNANLFVSVRIVNLDCCVNRVVWCFTTRGMTSVGQEEIAIVLETLPEENTVPRDIFTHLNSVYEDASKGNLITEMGHSLFNQSFLDSRDHGGFLYIRATFQCVQKLQIPDPPYLFGILLQKWETPWAKVFPIRLLLRLGAEYRYYPCPLIGVRNRKPIFFEIGHTIMNLLADFRNYQYMLPNIRGIHIHMEDKVTKINFPRNRYEELMKVVNNSNEHVMAIGANFSPEADSHLVCIQNDDGNYQTQAINIQNKPRKVTGASFVVFNGALKTSSGLSAKSSIVEDGLMVQITPDSMLALKQSIKDMQNYSITCGLIGAQKPDETVIVQWADDDKNVNMGVKSPIDFMLMDGIESLRIQNSTDYIGEKHTIRWTEIFFIQNKDGGSVKWEPVDLSRLGETLATACCVALTPHLEKLKEASLTRIGLRVTLGADNVEYEAGSLGQRLPDTYMNDLDNELIPVIHRATQQDGSIILELIFQVLD